MPNNDSKNGVPDITLSGKGPDRHADQRKEAALSTEDYSARFADLDLWPTQDVVRTLLEDQALATAAVQAATAAIAKAADEAAIRLAQSIGRLIYVGAGTSGRIAVQDGVELGPTFDWGEKRVVFLLAGGMTALTSSVEGAEDDAASGAAEIRGLAPTSHDVVVAIAASGRTPYTVDAVRTAAELGALTIGFANNRATPLLEAAHHPILLETGAEVIAGSTRMKAGTAQKIALNMFSTAVMVRLGRTYKGLMIDMRLSNHKLHRRAVRMICDIARVEHDVATTALDRAGGDLKLAALIALGVSLDQGRLAIQSAGGNLRRAIEISRSDVR